MPDFIFEPTPNKEAIAFLRDKPVVTQKVFKELLPELKARAFTIAGVECANTVQRVRDTLSDLPAGGDWNILKKQIASDLGPWFVDQAADADEQEKQYAAAEARAQLLLRVHGSQAYAATQYRVDERHQDAFPYRMYISSNSKERRPEHQALVGVCLPVDDPFWADHLPPWDWGCNCQSTVISREDYEAIQADDADRPAGEKLALEGEDLARLHAGELRRGNHVLDVRSPEQRGVKNAYRFDPHDLTLTADQLKGRYDAQTWQQFENWSQQVDVDGTPLYDWINGSAIRNQVAAARLPGVGSVMDYIITGKLGHLAGDLRQGIALLDQVPQPEISAPVVVQSPRNMPADRNGQWHHTAGRHHIEVSPSAPFRLETLMHEWAHVVDYEVGASKNAALLRVLRDNDSYRQLAKLYKNSAYHQKREELFARAYTQYVAHKTQNENLLASIDILARRRPGIFWTEAEFEKIVPLIQETIK
ncbi:MAG: phage head morphogenesis protein [Verrucomicrobiales bacterium]|jgi:hypothetical protein|nr:phage head morphogenesis protein [Verrucomicrobiales bacterium]